MYDKLYLNSPILFFYFFANYILNYNALFVNICLIAGKMLPKS